MTDRDAILARLRRRTETPVESPLAPPAPTSFTDPVAAFATTLAAVGGHCEVVERAGLADRVDALTAACGAERRRIELPGWKEGTEHTAADLDLVVTDGILAVAENAAVWVVPATDSLRAALFLTQHLALVVRGESVVQTMHEAYAAIDVAAAGFGVFISGPSKTADIEQSLVIGAHGPRSLTVYLQG